MKTIGREWAREWKATDDGLCHRGCLVFSDYRDADGKPMGGARCGILQESAPLNSGCKMLNIVVALEKHFQRKDD